MKSTNFFAAQERALRQSSLWRIFFLLTAAVIALLAGQATESMFLGLMRMAETTPPMWSARVSPTIFVLCFCFYVFSAIRYSLQLKHHGIKRLLQNMGAERIQFETTNHKEKQLINVTQEMALASGTRMPDLYVLPHEESFNAFTIGSTPQDTAVVVTEAVITYLTRDELQGVMAHEFSHILNADVLINTRFIPIARAILVFRTSWLVAFIAPLLTMPIIMGILILGWSASSILLPISIVLAAALVGVFGPISLQILQSMHSRSREWLADAAAVQFTRNPSGLSGALEKADRNIASVIRDFKKMKPLAHMFFASGMPESFISFLSTHPPLAARIRALGQENYKTPADKSVFRITTPEKPESERATRVQAELMLFKAAHLGPAGNKKTAIRLSQVLSRGGTANHDGLARARRIIYAAEREFSQQLENQSGIQAATLALALRLNSTSPDTISQLGVSIDPSVVTIIRTVFFPVIKNIHVEDCYALVPLVCLKSRDWSAAQKRQLLSDVIALHSEDSHVTPTEMGYILLLGCELFETNEPMSTTHNDAATGYGDVASLMSFVARAGHPHDEGAAQRAYQIGMSAFGIHDQQPQRLEDLQPESLLRAVGAMRSKTGLTKKRFLDGLVKTLLADESMNEDEFLVMRAICLSLGLPLPLELAHR